jgi:hypothetical protein
MYVATIPNRGSPPAILLRESYREAGKTKNRTLANLSDWPSERIELFRAVLRGDKLARVGDNGFESAAPSRMATSWPRSPSPGASASTIYCPAVPPNASAIWRWLSSLPGCSIRRPSWPPPGCSTAPPPATRWEKC